MTGIIDAFDATGGELGNVPSSIRARLACAYTTGSGSVPWSGAQLAAHPNAIHIDQSPDGHDTTADWYDVEAQAGTTARLPGWIREARGHYAAKTRPSQRWPGAYCNGSTLTSVANALAAGNLVNVPIWIARPGIGRAAAVAEVSSAGGPYPILGNQYAWNNTYDDDVFDASWADNTAGKGKQMANAFAITTLPPGQYEGAIILIGRGTDGELYRTTLHADGVTWDPPMKI